MEIQTSFAARLSELRHMRGLSQRRVASDLKISQALLSHYENGAREPGLGFVCRACDYYNVTADYLLGRAPNPDGSGSAAEVAKVFINELRVLANKAEAALEELG